MVPIEYTGDKEARTTMRENEFYVDFAARQRFCMFNVIVTTYEILKIDNVHLKSLPWRFVCADEAHRLKDKDGMTRGLVEDLDKDFLLLLSDAGNLGNGLRCKSSNLKQFAEVLDLRAPEAQELRAAFHGIPESLVTPHPNTNVENIPLVVAHMKNVAVR